MDAIRPGRKNLVTDVKGIRVGNASDEAGLTGVTVIVPDAPVVAAVDVRGGAPGTRDLDALNPAGLVEQVHAIVLSGGSVFGLDAAGGVVRGLSKKGVGLAFGQSPVALPIVPSAVLFDLAFAGGADPGHRTDYRQLAVQALAGAGRDFAQGNEGAGTGATAGSLKGGLGSASAVWGAVTIGALTAVNALGSCVNPADGSLWAAPFELGGEFAGRAGPDAAHAGSGPVFMQGSKLAGARADTDTGRAPAPGGNTTLAVIATDADLSKTEAARVAIMACDGMARAIRPLHTPFDGDVVFVMAAGTAVPAGPRDQALAIIGTLCADTLTRAIAHAILNARTAHGVKAYKGG